MNAPTRWTEDDLVDVRRYAAEECKRLGISEVGAIRVVQGAESALRTSTKWSDDRESQIEGAKKYAREVAAEIVQTHHILTRYVERESREFAEDRQREHADEYMAAMQENAA